MNNETPSGRRAAPSAVYTQHSQMCLIYELADDGGQTIHNLLLGKDTK